MIKQREACTLHLHAKIADKAKVVPMFAQGVNNGFELKVAA